MKTYDVVFYEVFKEEKTALEKFLPPNISTLFVPHTIQESRHRKPLAPLISIRTQSKIPLAWGSSLKGILSRSQGFDHLAEFRRQSRKNVLCGYLGSYCSRAVAEQAILAMMALWRKLKAQIKNYDSFNRDNLTGNECYKKRALVVGVGSIGKEIISLSRALKMEVKGVDIRKRVKDLKYVSLKEGLPWADVVFCAACLTDKTKGMLNYRALSMAKKGCLLINIARGEITPLQDLEKLMRIKILGGLALDVFEDEDSLAAALRQRKTGGSPEGRILAKLKNYDNVLLTPHNAFNTAEALERKAELSVQAVKMFLQKEYFPNMILK